MAEERDKGILKRIFSFGFGENKKPEAQDNLSAEATQNAIAEAEATEKPGQTKAEVSVARQGEQQGKRQGESQVVHPAPPQAEENKQHEESTTAESQRNAVIDATVQVTERKQGWFKRLQKGLAKSSGKLADNITPVFTGRKLDNDTLQNLEDILIQADLGMETADKITTSLASQRFGKDISSMEVRAVMVEEITKILEPVAAPLELDLAHQPHVILVVGVNGSGKTTTIGKISQKLCNDGFSTLLVAGDTFRAAAIEQLHLWGAKTKAPVISREHGADAASLAFDAYTQAKSQKKDVMLIDTAGRLQNKKELMNELEKITRVLKKQDPQAPHTVLLTLDATTGQNALNQVGTFTDVAGVNGLVMTKLDGTARGGILVAIASKYKLPVYFIGVGEHVEDLEPFEADMFAKAIAGVEMTDG